MRGYGGALKAFEKTIYEHPKMIQEYREEAVARREENKRTTDELIQLTRYLCSPGPLSRLKNWLAAKLGISP